MKGPTPEHDPRGSGLKAVKGDRLAIEAFDYDCREVFAATETARPFTNDSSLEGT